MAFNPHCAVPLVPIISSHAPDSEEYSFEQTRTVYIPLAFGFTTLSAPTSKTHSGLIDGDRLSSSWTAKAVPADSEGESSFIFPFRFPVRIIPGMLCVFHTL